ncbi:hypothetical protein HPB48_000305 [Haemaphysalis longicornis]|uniref:Uncharacterized protein n=1 Tax=Haemaphysalis longicornis TaxID=44386 RepID=A0A9J6G6W7_HAELO|nr:hypothetical protein HPB48_000305 [Haemaphysalis longicornis]
MLRTLLHYLFCARRVRQVRAGGAGFETADRQYGLAVRLKVTCSVYEHRVERFSSPRTEGSGNITPFEVNITTLKTIQSIERGCLLCQIFVLG